MSTSNLASLEDHSGALYWPAVQDVARQTYLNADTVQLLKERLKSEATHIVLNTLTTLHTISLNGSMHVRHQLALSKCMKHLERLLNRPPFPGVEIAAAQLLIDWAFLFGAEDLGNKSFHLLTNTSKHRAMIQGMQASDVAVMLREDQRLGMPRFVSVVKGLDFGRQFATQFASPLTGTTEPPSVLSRLAAAAVAASYSGSSAAAAAAAAASRNTFAAWAERVQGDPQAAAQQVLSSRQQVESDIAALASAQAAVLAAARPFLAAGASSSSSSSSRAAAAAANADYSQLRHELDRAYLVACKVTEWREMIQVLVQQQLPDTQLSSLLSLADVVNATLEEWSAAATTELFWLLGVNTAGLADGSLLRKIVPAATGVVAAAGSSSSSSTATAAAAGQTGSRQQQQQQTDLQGTKGAGSFTTRSSYLDLLTGDALPPSTSANNPFLTSLSSGSTVPASSTVQPPPAGRGVTGSIPPEVQSYIQETATHPAGVQYSPAAPQAVAPAAAAAAAGGGYPVMAPVAATAMSPSAVSAPSAAAGVGVGSGVQASGLYPAVPQPFLPQPPQYMSPPKQQQQQQSQQQQLPSHINIAATQQQQQQYSVTTQVQPAHQQQILQQPISNSGSGITGFSPSQQQQQLAGTAVSNVLSPAAAAAAAQRNGSGMGAGGTGSGSINSTGNSSSRPISTERHTVTHYSSELSSGTSAAAPAAAGGAAGVPLPRSSNSAAAGDTGSSADSAAGGGFSYINPFASLDTSTIMISMKSPGRRSSVDGTTNTAAAAAVTSSARVGSKSRSIDSSTAGAVGGAGVALSLKPHSCSTDSVGAASGATGTAAAPSSPQHQQQQRLWQQQQTALLKKREPPPPPPAAAAASAAAGATGATAPHMATAAAEVQKDYLLHVPQQNLQSSSNSSSSTGMHDTAAAAAAAAAAAVTADTMGHQQQQLQHTVILQPQQIELLQQKLHHTMLACSDSISGSKCQSCSMVDVQVLQSGLLQLLIQQQQDFEGRLQQLHQQHQKEVADLKATAIRKFKELQQELDQAKQQLQQHRE